MRLFVNMLCVVLLSSFSIGPTAAASEDTNWSDRIALKGDIRLRYEGIDEDSEEKRNRARFRARFGLGAMVTDDVRVVLQLASGGDNPVSTNQTFDDGFSTKDIGLDLAYVDWSAANGLHIYGGKMKNPLFIAGGAPLVWDSDLNPEGLAARYSKGLLFGTLAMFSVEERSSTDDSLLYAAQGGVKIGVGAHASITAGVGYLAYTNTIGNMPFYNGSSKGNSVDLTGNYIYDYKDIELFAQLDTKVGDWPLQLFIQAVRNNEVSIEDTAFAIGAKAGAASDKGKMEFGWTYMDMEADAVIGTFTDSNFGGGSVDSSGHIFKGKYGLSKTISLGGTLFINDVERFQGIEHDYSRVQIDVEFKFD